MSDVGLAGACCTPLAAGGPPAPRQGRPPAPPPTPGDHLIVGSEDNRLAWYDLDLSTRPYRALRFHSKALRGVAFHRWACRGLGFAAGLGVQGPPRVFRTGMARA